MNKVFAFLWLLFIGGNVAAYCSENSDFGPYVAGFILVSAVYFLVVEGRRLLQLSLRWDFLLALTVFVAPILIMVGSGRPFVRGDYITRICIALIFVVTFLIASRPDFIRTIALAAFVVVSTGAALNLYELFIASNTWSNSPGRSAGLYVNPNISADVLIGYCLIFLVGQPNKFRLSDYLIICLTVSGIIATFSRAGIIALCFIPVALLWRFKVSRIAGMIPAVLAISMLSLGFVAYLIENPQTSEDATMRLKSLQEESLAENYAEGRGFLIQDSFEFAMKHPLFGSGVDASTEGQETQSHNMFLALMIDYGIFGVMVYITLCWRLMLLARGASRGEAGIILSVLAWLLFFSFASHNLLTNMASIPLLGIAVARGCAVQASTLPRVIIRSRRSRISA